MNPHKVTVALIFTMQSRHLVPIFQRQYVWGEQDQWAPLWQDVILKAQELLTVPLPGRQPRKHFMGAVVLRGIPPTGLEHQAYEVIDGQQRLTTLQLLLIALRDYSRERSLTAITTLLAGMTANPPLVGAEYEQWKVIPTTRDRQDFQDVLEAGSPDELLRRRPPVRRKYFREPDPPPRILGAYYFFFAAIRRFTETNQDFDDERDASSTHGSNCSYFTFSPANFLGSTKTFSSPTCTEPSATGGKRVPQADVMSRKRCKSFNAIASSTSVCLPQTTRIGLRSLGGA